MPPPLLLPLPLSSPRSPSTPEMLILLAVAMLLRYAIMTIDISVAVVHKHEIYVEMK